MPAPGLLEVPFHLQNKTHFSHSTHKPPCGPCHPSPLLLNICSSFTLPNQVHSHLEAFACAVPATRYLLFSFLQLFARLGPHFLQILGQRNLPDSSSPLSFSVSSCSIFLPCQYYLTVLLCKPMVHGDGTIVCFAHICIPSTRLREGTRAGMNEVKSRNESWGVPAVAQSLTNLTRNHKVADSILGLAQWVKDLAC